MSYSPNPTQMDQQHLPAKVSLEYVFANIVNRAKIDERDYVHMMQLIIDGYVDLCIYHLNILRVRELDVEDGNLVKLPLDFLYYSRIGVLLGGKVHTLTKDETLPLPRHYECGEETQGVNMGLRDFPAREVPLTRVPLSDGFFADTGKNVGYYRIDEDRRLIVLKGTFPDKKIILEYATSGVNTDGSTLVSRHVVPALRAYVLNAMVEFDPRIHWRDKEHRKRVYMEELGKVRMIENMMTSDEWADMMNATKIQSPKR